MSDVFSLRLPKSLSKQIKELAKEEGVSMNLFISLALAEKVGAMQGVSYLEQRAARGSREKMLAVLAKAPKVEPEPYDRLDDDLEVAREKMRAVLAKVPNVEPEPHDRLDYDSAEDDERPERMLAEKPDEDYKP